MKIKKAESLLRAGAVLMAEYSKKTLVLQYTLIPGGELNTAQVNKLFERLELVSGNDTLFEGLPGQTWRVK